MSDDKDVAEENNTDEIIKRRYEDSARAMVQSIGSPRQLDMNAINVILALAPAWKESTWFGIRYPEQAIVLMARAYELGFGMTSAFDYFDVISTQNGTRIFLKPKAALALIYKSGLLKKLTIEDRKDACYVYMQRRDNDYGYGFEFTIDIAKRAGIYRTGQKGPSAWEAYPEIMLHWRAIGLVSQIVFPDVLSGLQMSTDYSNVIDVNDITSEE